MSTPLTYPEKVKYLRKRLRMTLTLPLRRLYKGISIGRKESSILLYATCVCCAMEALGKFINNNRGNKFGNFNVFASHMHPDLLTKKINGTTYAEILWRYFRNGLAHSLAICHGGFEHQSSYFVERPIRGRTCLYVDPRMFNDDFRRAIRAYFNNLMVAKPRSMLYRTFNKVFDDVMVRGK